MYQSVVLGQLSGVARLSWGLTNIDFHFGRPFPFLFPFPFPFSMITTTDSGQQLLAMKTWTPICVWATGKHGNAGTETGMGIETGMVTPER